MKMTKRPGGGWQAPRWYHYAYRVWHWAWCSKCYGEHPVRSRFRERHRADGDLQPIVGLIVVTAFLWIPWLIYTFWRWL
jgi:hypothetical protein